MNSSLLPKFGGYKKLLTYRLGILIYDATVAFCERYISKKDRTFDQMVQAARSGVANIIEGSEASATSKKTELKLTNVAKASQEELLHDYLAFLRHRSLSVWDAHSAVSEKVRQAKPETLPALRKLMASLVSELSEMSALSDSTSLKQEVAANTMICLIHQETFLLHRQITRLAGNFEAEGGFTERLYRYRKQKQ